LERTRRRECTTCGQLADRFLADYERTLKDSSIAYTGVRPGEMVALEWRDVDLRNGRLQVRRRLYQGKLDYPKTGPRMVALVPQARDALTGRPRLGARVHFEAPPSPVLRLTSLVMLAARVGSSPEGRPVRTAPLLRSLPLRRLRSPVAAEGGGAVRAH
jgi:integrase